MLGKTLLLARIKGYVGEGIWQDPYLLENSVLVAIRSDDKHSSKMNLSGCSHGEYAR